MTDSKCETCGEDAEGMLLGSASETPRRVTVLCARCGRLTNEVMQRELTEKNDASPAETEPDWAPAIIMAMRKQLSPEGSDDTPIECSNAEIEGESVAVAHVRFRDGPAMQFISDSGPLGLLTMLRVHMRRHLGLPDCDARDIDALRIIEAFALRASYDPSQPSAPWSVGPLGPTLTYGYGASPMEALFHCFNAAAGNTTKDTP